MVSIEFNHLEVIVKSPLPFHFIEHVAEFAKTVLNGEGEVVANSKKANAINASLYLERQPTFTKEN